MEKDISFIYLDRGKLVVAGFKNLYDSEYFYVNTIGAGDRTLLRINPDTYYRANSYPRFNDLFDVSFHEFMRDYLEKRNRVGAQFLRLYNNIYCEIEGDGDNPLNNVYDWSPGDFLKECRNWKMLILD